LKRSSKALTANNLDEIRLKPLKTNLVRASSRLSKHPLKKEDITTTRRYSLKDEQWEQITGSGGYIDTKAKDNQLFIEDVLCRYRTGIP
jgi:hypothetical protein